MVNGKTRSVPLNILSSVFLAVFKDKFLKDGRQDSQYLSGLMITLAGIKDAKLTIILVSYNVSYPLI